MEHLFHPAAGFSELHATLFWRPSSVKKILCLRPPGSIITFRRFCPVFVQIRPPSPSPSPLRLRALSGRRSVPFPRPPSLRLPEFSPPFGASAVQMFHEMIYRGDPCDPSAGQFLSVCPRRALSRSLPGLSLYGRLRSLRFLRLSDRRSPPRGISPHAA